LTIKRKDLWNTLILAAQAPVVAILVVLVFAHKASLRLDGNSLTDWGNVDQAVGKTVFLVTLASLWFGCSNAAREIVGEWAIYHRERMINLLVPSYIASKLTVLGGLCILQCAVLLGITHWGCSLKGPWLPMFLVLVLVSFVGVAIGLMLSALARTSEVAIGLLPIILLPMIILGGALMTVDQLRYPALSYAIPSRWAFEAALLLEADKQPRCPPMQLPVLAPGAPAAADKGGQDMAQDYIPPKYRFGVRKSMIVLLLLWSIAVAAVYVILRSRDVHRIGIRRRR
jgi:hypothetical protein